MREKSKPFSSMIFMIFFRQRQNVVLLGALPRMTASSSWSERQRSLLEEFFSGAFGLGYVLNFSWLARLLFFGPGAGSLRRFSCSRALREAVFSSVSIFAFSSRMRCNSFFRRFVAGIREPVHRGMLWRDGLSKGIHLAWAFLVVLLHFVGKGEELVHLPDDFFLLFEGGEEKRYLIKQIGLSLTS